MNTRAGSLLDKETELKIKKKNTPTTRQTDRQTGGQTDEHSDREQ